MTGRNILGILLIVAGILGIAYGRITYTKETHDAKLGPVQLSVEDKETVRIPLWAGVGVIAMGCALLLVPQRS